MSMRNRVCCCYRNSSFSNRPRLKKIGGEYPKNFEYEIIGLVTASSDAGWDADGDIAYAKEELKYDKAVKFIMENAK